MIDPSRFLMNGCCFSIFCENAKSHTGAFSCSDYIPFGAFWQAEPDGCHLGHNSKRPLPGRGKERLIFFLQRRLDLLDHLGVLRVGQLRLAGVHGEHAAPFKAVPVFRHEMDVQVAARVAVSTVVELIRMEDGVNRLRRARNSRNSGLSWGKPPVIFCWFYTNSQLKCLTERIRFFVLTKPSEVRRTGGTLNGTRQSQSEKDGARIKPF